MSKPKRKLTPAEKAAIKRRREEYMTIFVNGKQRRVRRPPTIDGIDVDEFILKNADPIWFHQNEMWEWEYMQEELRKRDSKEVTDPIDHDSKESE